MIARRAPKPMDPNDPMAKAAEAARKKRLENKQDKAVKGMIDADKKAHEQEEHFEEKGYVHGLSAPPPKKHHK